MTIYFQSWVEKHRDHIQKLETLLRMMDNDQVEVQQIKDIQEDIDNYILGRSSGCARDVESLDLFSASMAIQAAFESVGHVAAAADIKLDARVDITSETGFYATLNAVMRLKQHGLLFAGPPCSLFVFMSSSVHRRSARHPRGDERNFKVRLSNLIASNTTVVVPMAEKRGAWWI